MTKTNGCFGDILRLAIQIASPMVSARAVCLLCPLNIAKNEWDLKELLMERKLNRLQNVYCHSSMFCRAANLHLEIYCFYNWSPDKPDQFPRRKWLLWRVNSTAFHFAEVLSFPRVLPQISKYFFNLQLATLMFRFFKKMFSELKKSEKNRKFILVLTI